MSNQTNRLSQQARNPSGLSTAPALFRTETKSPSDAIIAERAYAKYESRGRIHGFDLEDWTAASHEILGSAPGHESPSHSPSRHPS